MKAVVKSLTVVALVIVAATSLFAADAVNVIDTKNADYVAPKAENTVKPERVFYAPNREVEGYVTLEILVDEQGNVEKANTLYRTSRFAVPKAVDAVSKWTFTPATLNGAPVKAWVAYNLPFGRDLQIFEETKYAGKIVMDNETLALK